MLKKITLLAMSLALASCASTQTATVKKNLQVDTRMSSSIFLDPVDPADQIIYVQVRNTSKAKDFDLESRIRAEMMGRGYKVTNMPSEANFMVQANIRNYTEQRVASDGSGESIIGAVVGGVLGSAIGDGAGQRIATTLGAVAGGAAGQNLSGRVLDITFTATVDIVIAERSHNGKITYNNDQMLEKGMGTVTTANFDDKSDWKKYRTTLVSKANKANLTIDEATPAIMTDITQSLSGLF
jgi:hypothetical protein